MSSSSNGNDETVASSTPPGGADEDEPLTVAEENASSPADSRPGSAIYNQLRISMALADLIRKQEPQPPEHSNENRIRTFLLTPGVQQGFLTACLMTAVFVPVRRLFLRVAKNEFNLGTIFPDLVLTPAMAMLTAQTALFVGSCYGSKAYLERLVTAAGSTTSGGDISNNSRMVNAVCDAPVTVAAMKLNYPRLWDGDYSSGSSSWDPRVQTVVSLQRALQRCRERQEMPQADEWMKNNSMDETTTTTTTTTTTLTEDEGMQVESDKDPASTTRISWWKSS